MRSLSLSLSSADAQIFSNPDELRGIRAVDDPIRNSNDRILKDRSIIFLLVEIVESIFPFAAHKQIRDYSEMLKTGKTGSATAANFSLSLPSLSLP